MRAGKSIPAALTIAGSDSGGGAGIQADLKTFAALKVYGLSVITCVTAQSPRAVQGIEACSTKMIRRQLETVLEEFRPPAVKTGMLFSTGIIRAVASFFSKKHAPLLVVDPVMISTSGRALLQPAARRALCEDLIPRAMLLTPNLHEAQVLAGRRIKSLADLSLAAREMHSRFGCAILAKGGHLPDMKRAIDIFFDGKRELRLSAPFFRGKKTHGTGCTYSAAVTACLARGYSLEESIKGGKKYITRAIRESWRVSGFETLGIP
jgi:hydroxymethylpyrimidine/phosphomethylpyrimidine kinase